VASTRTYLFARLWIGFSAEFPAEQFDDIADHDLVDVVGGFAADWMAEHGKAGPEPCDFREVARLANWRIPDREFGGGDLAVPSWIVFHSEADEESARDMIKVLKKRVEFSFGQYALRARVGAEMENADRALLELEIQDLDEWSERSKDMRIRVPDGWYYPFHALRSEALEFHPILWRVREKDDAASSTDPAKTNPEPHIDYVTLDEAAAICGVSKRTLENYLSDGDLPKADILGGGGRSSRWKWVTLKPALERKASRKLQDRPPRSRVLPPI
jgi:predicted DNA-binding transcriptional regulator AlpA